MLHFGGNETCAIRGEGAVPGVKFGNGVDLLTTTVKDGVKFMSGDLYIIYTNLYPSLPCVSPAFRLESCAE